MAIQSSFPSIKPSLLLDFANSKALDPRITFTRASTATYYDGKTVAKAEENLLLNSQDYSATWTVTDLNPVTGKTAPDATSTATEFEADDANGTLTQAVTAVAGDYTFSVFIRRVTGTGDVQISSHSGGTWVTESITSDWARYTVTQTLTAGSRTPGVRVVTSGDAIEVWGAQMEFRSAATAYTPTTTQIIRNYVPVLQTAAAGVGRFDHNPVTGACEGLLIEGQRTNLIADSRTHTALTQASAPSTTPFIDGTTSNVYLANNAAAAHRVAVGSISGGDATVTATPSVFVKFPTGSDVARLFFRFRSTNNNGSGLQFNVTAGVPSVGSVIGSFGADAPPNVNVNTGFVRNVGGGWYRIGFSGTSSSSALNTHAQLDVGFSATSSETAAGTANTLAAMTGWQLEVGANPTSYIPTTSATVTRAADAAVITGANFSNWYRTDQGTFYSEHAAAASINQRIYSASDNTTDNLMEGIHTTSGGGGVGFFIRANAVNQTTIPGGIAPVAGQYYKLAAAYATNDASASRDGGTVATANAVTLPIVNRLNIGTSTLNGTIRKIAYYPIRLPNATLQAMTS